VKSDGDQGRRGGDERTSPVTNHPAKKALTARRLVLVFSLPGLLVVVPTPSALAGVNQWTTHGPPGGDISALAVDPVNPRVVFAGTELAGVFKSTDGGQTWAVANAGMGDAWVRALAVDPKSPLTVYAGTTDDGVFKTTDGGQTWAPVNNGLPGTFLDALAIDPDRPRILYASPGTAEDVFKTTDGGQHWKPASRGLPHSHVHDLVVDPTAPQVLYAATDKGVFKTLDGGRRWRRRNSGLTVRGRAEAVLSLAIDPQDPQVVLAGTFNGVFNSTDGGASWSRSGLLHRAGDQVLVLVASTAPGTFYAGTQLGVVRTTDGGSTWQRINKGLGGRSMSTLVSDPTTALTLYAGAVGVQSSVVVEAGGVFKTADGGASWAESAGPSDLDVHALALDPTDPQILYAGTPYGIFKTKDDGDSWAEADAGITDKLLTALSIDPSNPQVLYAGFFSGGCTDFYGDGGVFKTTDGGETWTSLPGGGANIDAIAVDPTDSQVVYVASDAPCGEGVVVKTTDGGSTWETVNKGLGNTFVNALAVDPITTQTLYAGTYDGLFKTTDGGKRWDHIAFGDKLVGQLVIDSSNHLQLFASVSGNNPGLYETTDGGTSWHRTGNQAGPVALDPSDPSILYAGTDSGVLRSTDGGLSWSPLNDGLTNLRVAAVAVDATGTGLHAGTIGAGEFDFQFG
jgi:photosystem II stability/assembly factor-like uncharacterized protein